MNECVEGKESKNARRGWVREKGEEKKAKKSRKEENIETGNYLKERTRTRKWKKKEKKSDEDKTKENMKWKRSPG